MQGGEQRKAKWLGLKTKTPPVCVFLLHPSLSFAYIKLPLLLCCGQEPSELKY